MAVLLVVCVLVLVVFLLALSFTLVYYAYVYSWDMNALFNEQNRHCKTTWCIRGVMHYMYKCLG